ncbi:MAG: HAD-IIIC family phosphatase [Acidobacteria bacterium]|nr:HAD-IIIC family phosphatase [Acidobacteriota bacterium]
MNSASSQVNIRIAANFTIEPIEEFLSAWMSVLRIPAEIRIAPYNQVFQQLLEGGLLRNNARGINLVALDLDGWLPTLQSFQEASTQLQAVLDDFMSVLHSAGSAGVSGAVLLFPPVAQLERSGECSSVVAAAKARVLAQCPTVPGWTALDLEEAVKLYAISETRDPFTDELGNIPFTEEMYAAAATVAARWIRASCSKPRKVIVLDADNTLWQGICGEGSMAVTPPYRRLQQFMLNQRESGMLLALVSKNNEDELVGSALASEACLLRTTDFAAWRINWQSKSENLEALSKELGLGLDTFILVDDNSFECMEVRNRCPEVLAVQLPSVPDAIPAFLNHMWIFDHSTITEEDRNRARMYQAERQRNELNQRALTPEEFLRSLKIEIDFAPCLNVDLRRVSQLTQRTTQFNMTGVQHSEQSLSALLAQGTYECWTVRVRDIFGDYGLVGAVLFRILASSLHTEIFLLSCRALGRRVEDRMVDELIRLAREREADRLVIPVIPTGRNRPAREFLARFCGASPDCQTPYECIISATDKQSEWRHTKPDVSPSQALSPDSAKLPVVSEEEDKLLEIATELQTASSIINAFRRKKKPRPSSAGPLIPPTTAIEEALVRIWSDCLEVERIGIRDNFFDFGGHSLRATRVLTRVRAEFGIELSLTMLFKTPTIEAMSAAIADMSSLKS